MRKSIYKIGGTNEDRTRRDLIDSQASLPGELNPVFVYTSKSKPSIPVRPSMTVSVLLHLSMFGSPIQFGGPCQYRSDALLLARQVLSH